MWELHCVLEMTECCFKILISVKAERQENQTILQMFVYSQYFTTVHTLWRLRILEWRQSNFKLKKSAVMSEVFY